MRLVHSVEGGVARVELDGGEGGLTAGGSGISHGGSDGGGSSQGSGGSSNGGHGSSHGGVQSRDSGVVDSWHSSNSGVVESRDSGESGVVEGKSSGGESGEVESGGVRVGEGSDGGSSNNSLLISVTLLPLGVSGLQESEMGSLGLSDLRGVLDGLRGDSGEDRGDQGLGVEGGGNQGSNLGGSESSGADWKVGASNSESIDWVGLVVLRLQSAALLQL